VEKLVAAMFAAKVDGLTVTLRAAGGRLIHRHATNGVDCHDNSPFHLTLKRMRLKDRNSTERSRQHGTSPFLKPPLDAGEGNCQLASSNKLERVQNEKSRRVRTPLGVEHVGLMSDKPPRHAGLLFI
jgi:hypothetical protein